MRTSKQISLALEQYLLVQKILASDITIIQKQVSPGTLPENKLNEAERNEFLQRHQTAARFLIKTEISYIDAICNQLRLIVAAIDLDMLMKVLDPPERIALSNMEVFVTAKGDAQTRQMRLPFFTNLELSISLFIKAFELDFKLDKSGIGWDRLNEAVRARNRITHPKNSNDLIITAEQLTNAGEGFHWFTGETSRMFKVADFKY